MGLRMKSCSIMRILWKIRFLGGSRKTSIEGELSKRGRGGQLADLRGGLAKKRGGGGGLFEGEGRGLIPQCTLWKKFSHIKFPFFSQVLLFLNFSGAWNHNLWKIAAKQGNDLWFLISLFILSFKIWNVVEKQLIYQSSIISGEFGSTACN